MVAYLLCAGFGTRMRPLTDDTPKSLLQVAGRPLLSHLLDEMRAWTALDAIHVAVNHRDVDSFRKWASSRRADLTEAEIALQVHDDGVTSADEQLGALGDLHFLIETTGVPSDGALVSGGDSLYRFPLPPLLNSFDGTISHVLALHEPDANRRRHSSILQLNGRRVTGLAEDPAESASERICPSFHLLTPDALATVQPYLDAGGDPDTLGSFIHALAQRQRVDAIRLPEQKNLRLHCNTPEDLERARVHLNKQPRVLISAETVRQCLMDRSP